MTSPEVADVQVTKTAFDTRTIPLERVLFYVLAATALVYALSAGLKTIAEFDLGWQMATGRWIVQHHQIPSTEVFSYTAAGQPWIYPVGAGLLFYGAFLLGGYTLISWMVAAATVGTVALLLRRGSLVTGVLAILAVPLIATRTNARAEMFTMLLFAATLSLLWQQHESGDARLWLLPVMMAAWVNLHPGFIAGLGLLGAYAGLEILQMLAGRDSSAAAVRLRGAWPWLIASGAATVINPWGWGIYRVIMRQDAAMQVHSQLIMEWSPIPMNWSHIKAGLSLRDPDEFYVLLLIVVAAVVIALLRWQFGAAILMGVAPLAPIRHVRFIGLFGIIAVIVGGAVLTSFLRTPRGPCFKDEAVVASRWNSQVRAILAIAVLVVIGALAAMRAHGLVTNRIYLSGSNIVAFGTGLSWWLPDQAAAFVEKENLPGQIFSTGSEGAFMAFRLGPKYQNYIDGRAIPFGTDLMLRSGRLKATPPDAPEWQQEIQRYDINTLVIPIGRFGALQFFPYLKQYCQSNTWRPVYLDESSVVFVRRRPENESLIQRLQIDCATAPLPRVPIAGINAEAFNQWANAASVLHALGRDSEAFAATTKALSIFSDSGYIHWTRGHMFREGGNLTQAEQEYRLATKLEPRLVAPWSALADYYQEQGRLPEAIHAWETAAEVSRWPWEPLVSLGYANLLAHRPKEALAAFDAAAASLPVHAELMVANPLRANIAHGRARSWYYLGDLRRAIVFEEQAAQLLPNDTNTWIQLADLYDRAGRVQEANQIRARAGIMGRNAQLNQAERP